MQELIKKYLNKKAQYGFNGLKVEVKIVDVKRSYGHTRLLIQPKSGSGAVWVEESHLTIDKS